ncbi:MAG: cytochrome c [Bacteroidales bacterium]|nr:cytochrome c [Bacteroidales bacterium]MCF8334919.1 cytochrome c [Bacteroidales bacterium]
MKKLLCLNIVLLIAGFVLTDKPAFGQDNGKALFKQNSCQGCHTINEGRMVGPDLAGISQKRSRSWLIDFIQSPQTMIQNGDSIAVSLYEEYNKVMMPENDLSPSQIDAILQYIKNTSNKTTAATAQQKSKKKTTFTAANFKAGKILFTGKIRFFNKGPSCISCHTISTQQNFTGGNIAKDLANSYKKLGENGVKAILKNPSFPVMKAAYQNNPLLETEIHNLTAYLKQASTATPPQQQATLSITSKLIIAGVAGMGLLLFLFTKIWRKRKHHSVNEDIYKRQLKTS